MRIIIGDVVDVCTCPIWASAPKNKTDDDSDTPLFDRVNAHNHVNLWFMLYATKSLPFVNNYAKMSFFKIGDICKQLGVLKLKNLTPAIKSSTPIYPSFKNAVSWLMGVWNVHGNTIQNQYILKVAISSLYSRGLVKKNNVSIESLKKTD